MTKRKPNRDGSRIYGDTPARFDSKVDQNGPESSVLGSRCWTWLPPLRPDGYGQFWITAIGRAVVAHRYSYERHVGPIPDGLTLDHLCRNRACVNPDHLEPVTRGENVRRGMHPNMISARSGKCSEGHALDERGDGQRRCRTCHKANRKRRRAEARQAANI